MIVKQPDSSPERARRNSSLASMTRMAPLSRESIMRRSNSNEEALGIVDGMLAGAEASHEQLLIIRSQLMNLSEHWLNEMEEGWLKESLMQLVMAKVPQPRPRVKSLPRGTTPATCLPPGLRIAFARAAEWEMPIWEIGKLTNGKPLSSILLWICDELGFYDSLMLDPGSMRRFANKTEVNYNDNPYHNKWHAATVTLTMFQIILHSGILDNDEVNDSTPTKLYILAAILAAAVHDVNHPGVGNDFRVKSADSAAMLYHDRSVNENEHLSSTFRIISETNVLRGLTDEARRIVRAVIIDMVLKTDMSVHFDVLAKFRAATIDKQPSHEDMMGILSMFMKCADLAHSCFVWPEHVRWVKMLQEEFHQQGDMEKQLHLSGSPLTDRSKSLGPAQAKFFEAIIIPLYTELAANYPKTVRLLDQATKNWQQWADNGGVIPEADSSISQKLARTSSQLPPLSEAEEQNNSKIVI